MTRFGASARGGALGIIVLVLAACGGGATPTPAAVATPGPTATSAPASTAAPSPSPAAVATARLGGPATLDAPAEIAGGTRFQVAWTGPNGQGDYVTIIAQGAERWTNESFFYTTAGSPGPLVSPTTAGDFEIWYVVGADSSIAARRPIKVKPFEGALAGPATVTAGTSFTVSWNGPDGPGDYVTIVAKGAERWTNEAYFYTANGSPGTLVAPIKDGAYELWYVTGGDGKTMARTTITVQPFAITLKAPDSVTKDATFEVTWTGPNGPSDYITIAPAGSSDGTYLSYAYTASGSPATLTAPPDPGAYEIRYASDRVPGTFARIPIVVK